MYGLPQDYDPVLNPSGLSDVAKLVSTQGSNTYNVVFESADNAAAIAGVPTINAANATRNLIENGQYQPLFELNPGTPGEIDIVAKSDAVPEPSSILGSAIALGLVGAGLKRKFAQSKAQVEV